MVKDVAIKRMINKVVRDGKRGASVEVDQS
jgi:hypothetical protein